MALAVRPPAYFPPLFQTSLIYQVDHFIIADTFRFRRGTFHNRSKLRNAHGGHWVTIPLFGHAEGVPLCDVSIETGGRWREKHWRSFFYDYRSAPYFPTFKRRLRTFFETEWTTLSACTSRSLELQMDLFGIDTTLTRASELEGSPRTLDEVLEVLDTQELVIGMSEQHPQRDSVDLRRFSFEHPTYRQNFEGFETGLSAMDLLLNYGPPGQRFLAEAGTLRRDADAPEEFEE